MVLVCHPAPCSATGRQPQHGVPVLGLPRGQHQHAAVLLRAHHHRHLRPDGQHVRGLRRRLAGLPECGQAVRAGVCVVGDLGGSKTGSVCCWRPRRPEVACSPAGEYAASSSFACFGWCSSGTCHASRPQTLMACAAGPAEPRGQHVQGRQGVPGLLFRAHPRQRLHHAGESCFYSFRVLKFYLSGHVQVCTRC